VGGHIPGHLATVTDGSDSMGPEINTDSICDLERRIEEGAGDVIQLRRTRNSLLNISTRVPPEILGSVFRWNVIPSEWDGLQGGSYNFLLVCHHWFEVASHTPELWAFWGNTLEQWSRRYKCSEIAPVDLALTRSSGVPFDGPLREAVRDRAARNTIRSVFFMCAGMASLTSILPSIIPEGEDIRCSSIESISFRDVDASNFFARCRFPKLWELYLSVGTKISSWEHPGLHTTTLTTLYLTIEDTSPIPTTSQLLSILASNPRLQDLTLDQSAIPRDNGNGSTSQVPLHHLKYLSLDGDFHHVFQLLRRLDHPETMDESIDLTVLCCTAGDISDIFGPYVREFLRRDERSRDQLGVAVGFDGARISVEVSTIGTANSLTQRVTFAIFTAFLHVPPIAEDELFINFVACTPGEQVVYLGGYTRADVIKGIVSTMPNIQELHLPHVTLSDGFLQPDPDRPFANTKLLPSLRRLHLEDVDLHEGGDWTPLLSYLAHQTSGGQAISLSLSGRRLHICKGVVRDIEGLVEEFTLNLTEEKDCPFDSCSVDEDGR
jgi:hypothetical protein